jgi:hypothetical protein
MIATNRLLLAIVFPRWTSKELVCDETVGRLGRDVGVNILVLESYITHVRIIEDSHYPSTRPPASSPESSKKHRIIVVALRKSGRVRVHKARENKDGTIQIGKTWNMDELTMIENDLGNPMGFTIHLGKPYYWATQTPKEKAVIINFIIKIYKKYTGGKVPRLSGLDSIVDGTTRTPGAPPASPLSPTGPFSQPPPAQTIRATPAANLSTPTSLRPPPPPVHSTQPALTVPPTQPVQPVKLSQPVRPLQQAVPPLQGVQSAPGRSPSEVISPSALGAVKGERPRLVSAVSEPPARAALSDVPPGPPRQKSQVQLMQAKLQAQMAGNESPRPVVRPRETPSPQRASPTHSNKQSPAQSSQVSPGQSSRSLSYESSSSVTHVQEQRKNSGSALTGPVIASTAAVAASASLAAAKTVMPPPSKGSSLTGSAISPVASRSKPLLDSSALPQSDSRNVSTDSIVSFPKMVPSYSRDSDRRPSAVDKKPATRVAEPVASFASPKIATAVSAAAAGVAVPVTAVTTSTSADISPGESRENLNAVANRSASVSNESLEVPEYNKRSSIQDIKIFARSPSSPALEAEEISREPSPVKADRRVSFIDALAVEETLEEFNWTGRDDAISLEMEITKALGEIEAMNLRNVVDLDDRLDELDRSLDVVLDECDKLDTIAAFLSVQHHSFGDDISHIESQGQGLQVQTTNQKILWNELDNILKTVALSDESIHVLQTGTFESMDDLARTEGAVMELYQAVRAARQKSSDKTTVFLGEMKAIREKQNINQSVANEFMVRFKINLDGRVKAALKESQRHLRDGADDLQHIEPWMMQQLYPLSGIILFVKEVEPASYEAIVHSYQAVVKPYLDEAISGFIGKTRRQIASVAGNPDKLSFGSKDNSSDGSMSKSLKRSGTMARFKESAKERDRERDKVTAASVTPEDVSGFLDNSVRAQIRRSLKHVFEGSISVVVAEQEVLTRLFHLSSFGGATDFQDFMAKYPIQKRMKPYTEFMTVNVREVDPDYRKAKELAGKTGALFDTLLEQMTKFCDYFTSTFELCTPGLITLIDIYRAKFSITNQDFLSQSLTRLRDRVCSAWQSFVDQQVAAIDSTSLSSKKRRGPATFVKLFPRFCRAVESDLADMAAGQVDLKDLPVRRLIDTTYETFSKAIFRNRGNVANESRAAAASASTTSLTLSSHEDYEDKEMLNYHILMIENMHVLIDSFADTENGCLMAIKLNAQNTFRDEMNMYIAAVLHRPVGKILDLVTGVKAIMQKNENPISRHGYSKSSFRKVMAGFDAKEVRKGVETLRRRVEKHFGDEDLPEYNTKLVDRVWTAIQAEYLSLYSNLVEIEGKFYLEAGEASGLEFTKADLASALGKK